MQKPLNDHHLDSHGVVASVVPPLSAAEYAFCASIPKLEVHAHLNGSIPRSTIAELKEKFLEKNGVEGNEDLVSWDLDEFTMEKIDDFFPLFSSKIYRLTSSPSLLAHATAAVLDYFQSHNVAYLELRSTPRLFADLDSFLPYIQTILSSISDFAVTTSQKYRPWKMVTKLVLSVDRRHSMSTASQIIDAAIMLKNQGEPVVGIDLCGDPRSGDPVAFRELFLKAKHAGLGTTVHFAEIPDPPSGLDSDMEALRFLTPDRLGHGTYIHRSLSTEQWVLDSKQRIAIEMCITSNVFCGTVASLEEHHVRWAIQNEVPILICTDDSLVFRCSPTDEYSLVLSLIPGAGHARRKVLMDILSRGVEHLFCDEEEKQSIKRLIESVPSSLEAN
ncbi:Metallo-dependent hydrolase [Atractiella rhizophila]|nr:Metallo-dependent hydrolase [Atractiella rhizophila]